MPEFIERSDAEKAIREYADIKHNNGDITTANCVLKAVSVLKEIPAADAIEIVMCKDCAHAVEHKYSPAFFKCDGCSFLKGRLVSSNFWCKCGERRTE